MRIILSGNHNGWTGGGRCVEGMLDDCDFTLLNTGQATHQNIGGGTSVLDLSFASSSIANKCEWSVINNALGSDHMPTFIDLAENIQLENNTTPKWKLQAANWQQFKNVLNSVDGSQLIDTDIDKYNSNITGTIIQAAGQSIPKTNNKSKNIKTKAAPYWNETCTQAIRNRIE